MKYNKMLNTPISKSFYVIKTNGCFTIDGDADGCYSVLNNGEIVGEFIRKEYAENFLTYIMTAIKCGFTLIECPYDMLYPTEQLAHDLKALEMIKYSQMLPMRGED